MGDSAKSENPQVQAQLDRLAKLSQGEDRLGLERIDALLERLGRPQDRLPPVFHVAGTNGKGSTCAFLRAILEASGKTVHAFTSPHLVRYNERIRVAGSLIADEELAALLTRVLDASDGIEPSFFEVTTAAALLAFAETPADACVLEVGLGGRLDATNVVTSPLVCGIAQLGLDHTKWLGETLADIAGEKAGIAKAGVPLVTQRYAAPAAQQVQQKAEAAGAPWIGRGALWDARVIRDHIRYRDRAGGLKLPMPGLPGAFQADNAALAVAMLRFQDKIKIGKEAIAAGIRSARWPARLHQLAPGPLADLLPRTAEAWVDGGHNPNAARRVSNHIRATFPGDLPLALVFASLKTKEPRAMLRPFKGLAAAVITLPITDHDAFSQAELLELAREMGFNAVAADSLEAAFRLVRSPSRVLVFGSLYLAGQVLSANGEIPD
ncbi:bifunctional folylpolyglutamate synthase/dihydrofolate synthase [Sphingomonas sabuli]|uniref:tetrahydrofolate synthase n=1 Tax=Sphingomonas sabuli TaxID=2764186 RepID=A0A7G9L3F2_9SPHN|nr:folylpolyglutamate synthase/dihydrofolate synthase family protein [Sphingomonas sabuli]QNM83151.1 bifunctional folylpolyglutamate synthase/dihydrofolate synthase [Sphingomonas sabuli]